ncbi:DUF2207 domain-containing protein [Hwanghaeella grinnelliae]|uniref:DUF2207 domain-containing protein n=1 Tax=Hwanghaeella grinnelliae TaxID=2500179 RepID=UPI0013875A1A|nr:DUF2207 domain-containing protein [Hwanghaeella grinnelliae]
MRVCACILASFLLLGLAFNAAAEERITDYDIQIIVEETADLTVTETIQVVSEGVQIRRGIFRDLPVVHNAAAGLFDLVDYEVLAVTRDGNPEPYFTVPEGEFFRIYIGHENRFLEDGPHRYKITYRVGGQIRFSENSDELYWNLTGTNWAFPIENVTASIVLPKGAAVVDMSGYTGGYGDTGSDYEILNSAGNKVSLRATRRLESGEGVTVSVSWPPGFLPVPGVIDRASDLLTDNPGAAIGAASLAFLAGYLFLVWWRVGRDPQAGTIIPLFEPPEGFSPAAIGHIYARGFTDGMAPARALTVGITSLAVKGFITVEDLNKNTGTRYILRRTDKPADDLPKGELALLNRLFSGDEGEEVTLGSKYDATLGAAKNAYMKAVGDEYSTAYFRKNNGKWFLGVVFAAVASIGSAVLNAPGGEDGKVLAGALALFFCVLVSVFYWTVRNCWAQRARLGGAARRKRFLVAFLIMLIAAAPAGLFAAGVILTASLPVALMIAAMIGLVFGSFDVLDSLTVRGRAVMDEIEGYIVFMTTTDWDRMEAIGEMPTPSEAMFEKNLPYSIALGVDDAWTRTFLAYAKAASIPVGDHKASWYRSTDSRMTRPTDFSKSFSSRMVSTMASASSRPSSSSSGSRSSGSSGGGGGGGGGGGW